MTAPHLDDVRPPHLDQVRPPHLDDIRPAHLSGMRLTAARRAAGRDPRIARLTRRVLSPWCGLSQSMGFILRGTDEPRFIISGAQLTGVHVLLGRARANTYHIGGVGVFRDEAVIRSIGETIERYGQLVAPVSGRYETRFTSYRQLRAAGETALPTPDTPSFSAEQYADEHFPYRPLDADAPLTWVRCPTLADATDDGGTGDGGDGDGGTVWVPAQLLFIGYQLRVKDGEPWLSSAITTGSAAHTDPARALRSALLEMIQLDGAMGHWYSGSTAPRIVLDDRTRALESVLDSHVGHGPYTPDFHWIPVPGFDVRAVACVMRGNRDAGLGSAVGLGIDTRLDVAMYKALLEASATVQLAKMLAISPELVVGAVQDVSDDPARMLDLDSNVAHYADPSHQDPIDRRFPRDVSVPARELPPDDTGPVDGQITGLLDQFRAAGIRLAVADCTTPDIADLGFVVTRVWSPDLLLLCLPSAPPTRHPRFASYGGARYADPHPYA
ncbi:hypothetical protein G5C60_04920 [Streptomyces sp. HC44]|uniref:YcaO domain-containing protein n=1 Tax=Streptomyces scabichelini TaxID=2711217 RepID=A0A6G4UZ39_9ACTN|nr:YcaO-like family protein [Streptomyces scabichelini]NGO07011.1 hypothetical protein [Streptomyces scabichelini]